MNPQIVLFLRVILLPIFALGFYMQSMWLSSPEYIGGMGGFGAFFGFIFLIIYTLIGGVLFWLYTRLFNFSNGNAKPDFLIHFFAYLIPLCYNYIRLPPIEFIWRDIRDDYIVNTYGFFCVAIMLGFTLFLYRLDTKKSIVRQFCTSFVAVFASFYGTIHLYCIYAIDKAWGFHGRLVTSPEMSKKFHELFTTIYNLLPAQFHDVQYIITLGNSSRIRLEDDGVVIFLLQYY